MHGVKVIELGMWVAAPGAAHILADWGADVIKVEPPGGDPMRMASKAALPPDAENNPWFDPDNRGKRSVELDLRNEAERESLLALLDSADVFVTNVRAAGLARLGLDADTVLARNPRLIYAIVTGYGLTGPDADTGAYDLGAFWARGGVAELLSAPGQPPPIQRPAMGDHWAAMSTVAGICGALFERERTGRGQMISTSLLRIAAYNVAFDYNIKLMLGVDPPHPDRTTEPNPLWNNYAASDGRRFWLISPAPDRHWAVLARLVGHPEWVDDPRHATRATRAEICAELIAQLDEIFAGKTYAEWAALFDAEPDFFWATVHTVDDVINDPQSTSAGWFVDVEDRQGTFRQVASPMDFHGTPCEPVKGAPLLVEHTKEFLAEIGRSSA